MIRRAPGPWLGLALGLAAACFQAPRPAVQFSCDPDDAPECPEGYSCEDDGCCHLDGSDVDAHRDECKLGVGPPTAGTGLPTTTDPSGSTADPSTGDSTGDSTGASTSASTGGSTAADSTGSSGSTDGSGSTTSTR